MKPTPEALIKEALKWQGVRETSPNMGKEVEDFQRAVDGVSRGESWCMAFVFYCLFKTGGTDLYRSEHVLTVWNRSEKSLRLKSPKPGCIAIWRKQGTIQGHAGIVIEATRGMMSTVEGNTGPGTIVNREGDGVYLKRRIIGNVGKLELLGFLWPWLEKIEGGQG